MSYETIILETENNIARLTLNRPSRLNSFNVAMHEEVRDALDRIEADEGLRVLLLTGAGRAFCAGQDLSARKIESGGKSPDLGASIDRYYSPLVRRLRSLALPVMCAVNGAAAGAGANVALACDLVIAARSAKFIQAFAKVGLIPDSGGTYFLPRRVGMARAMGMAMLGESISAEQAASWGLIWECVDDGAFSERIDTLATHLAKAPTKGLARTKQAFYAGENNSLDVQLDLERDTMRELGRSHDYAEGVAAFNEKRSPNFVGR